MNRPIEIVAFASVLVVALTLPSTPQATELTAQNRAELANVPTSWKDVHICFREGVGVSGPRVVIGVEGKGLNAQFFSLRPERPEATLPAYLQASGGDLTDKQIWVTPSAGVGYLDEYFDVFVMPNGIRMTCEALPDR